MFKRIRYQFGCIERKGRRKGPDVGLCTIGSTCPTARARTEVGLSEASNSLQMNFKRGRPRRRSCLGLTRTVLTLVQ